jgi:uncharacterized protein YdeI (YjbR/CyaY-like superfamily)
MRHHEAVDRSVPIRSEPIAFASAEQWRTWLEANHATASEAWVTISKKAAKEPLVTLAQATEEALCFGWIDSAMRPIDDERFALRYTPRRPGSRWSEVNKRRAMQLIAQGRMTEAGLARIEEARRNGRWGADPEP